MWINIKDKKPPKIGYFLFYISSRGWSEYLLGYLSPNDNIVNAEDDTIELYLKEYEDSKGKVYWRDLPAPPEETQCKKTE